MMIAFLAGRGESQKPWTKEDQQREDAKNPPKPSEEDWQITAEEERAWKKIRHIYFAAAQSAYHFEEAFGYRGHYLWPGWRRWPGSLRPLLDCCTEK